MYILKDALVFTLNPVDDFCRYSFLIDNGLIADVIKKEKNDKDKLYLKKYDSWIKRYSKADIIDCSHKMIIPSLTNSCLKSEGSLIRYLLRRRQYESITPDLCTDFIFNYIYQDTPSSELDNDLSTIYNFSFARNLKNGITHINEISPRKDNNHLGHIEKSSRLTGQKVKISYPVKQNTKTNKPGEIFYYLTDENQLTIYELSMLSELKSSIGGKLFIEAAINKEVTEKFKQTFNKPVITLLDEYNLIDSGTSLINPLYLTYDEILILEERKANIIICPRDLRFFSRRYFPFDDFVNHNLKYSIGTGWLGEDIFKELREFRNVYRELNIPASDLLNSIISTPRNIFNNDGNQIYSENFTGNAIDINKPADLAFIDISDLRFQVYPESISFNSMCEFLVDNLVSYNIHDVMIDGEFYLRNNKLTHLLEEDIIKSATETRNRLYKVGKFKELSDRNEQRQNIEELDLRGRDDEEIKLFSSVPASESEPKDEFRIKGKIPVFRHKTSPLQKNLFEQSEIGNINITNDIQETPVLNLLYSEIEEQKMVTDEIQQVKMVEEIIFKQKVLDKKIPSSSTPESGKKVELPKDVKLKFGD